MKRLCFVLAICTALFLHPGTALGDNTVADSTTETDPILTNWTTASTYSLNENYLQPRITVTGNGGVSVLDHIGGGQVYWAVEPAFSPFYTFHGTLSCTNNRTSQTQYRSISSRGTGRTEGNVQFNVSDGNTYTVTMDGYANGVGAVFYYVPAGVSVRFSVRF